MGLGRVEKGLSITVEIPAHASLDVQIADRSYDLAGIERWAAQQMPTSAGAPSGAIVMTDRFRWAPSHPGITAGSPREAIVGSPR
jgi:hypothetical protein